MKVFLLTVFSLTAPMVPAAAADISASSAGAAPNTEVTIGRDWSGFYAGINGGWGQSRDNRSVIGVGTAADYDGNGGTVGGQVGYRWQMDGWVSGLEGQGNWADLSGSSDNLLVPGGIVRSKTKAFGLFTGQVGYAWNDFLVYVKGGAAITRRNYQFLAPGGVLASETGVKTRFGGTVGVGTEYALSQNWSLGVEYNRIFETERDVSFTVPKGPSVQGFKTGGDTDLVLARLNYKF